MKQGIISLILLLTLSAGASDGTDVYDVADPVTIEGSILRSKDKIQIKLPDDRVFDLQSSKRQTQDDIGHLENGDHLIGLGRLQTARKIIMLEDLEMVGIRRVLGPWQETAKRKIFQFHDFTSVSVKELAGVDQNLNYRLVPDQKDTWTIFLSSNTSVKVGTLKYNPTSMKMEFIDLNSGKVTEQFNLSPHQTKRH